MSVNRLRDREGEDRYPARQRNRVHKRAEIKVIEMDLFDCSA